MNRTFDKNEELFRTVPQKVKSISCQEAAMLIDKLAGEAEDVSADDKIALTEHLRTCRVCGVESIEEAK